MITLLTDFGLQDAYIGAMKGVIANINKSAQVVDISHLIPAQYIYSAQYVLNGYYPYYPKDTIHLIIVDPGVGTSRKIVGIETDQHTFIAPDNGLLTHIVQNTSIKKVVDIKDSRYFLNNISNTFHGRDKFAPIVAHLSNGISLDQMGDEMSIDQIVTDSYAKHVHTNEDGITGEIIHIDHFGNLISNLTIETAAEMITDSAHQYFIEIKGNQFPLKATYGEVGKGNILGLWGSQKHLELSQNCGSAAQHLQCSVGTSIKLVRG